MKYRLRGDVIRAWRRREGRSLTWLAERVGVSPSALSHQVSGRVGLSLGTALRLEAELGIPVRDLVEATASA